MLSVVKTLVGIIVVCITFLMVTALYVIWSPMPLNSPTLWRCSATAGLFAFVSSILLTLVDTLRKHSDAGASRQTRHEKTSE